MARKSPPPTPARTPPAKGPAPSASIPSIPSSQLPAGSQPAAEAAADATVPVVQISNLPADVLKAVRDEAAADGITTDAGACRRALSRYVRGKPCVVRIGSDVDAFPPPTAKQLGLGDSEKPK